MTISFINIMLLAILACTAILGYGIVLIDKDIEELNELIKRTNEKK